MPPTIGQHPVDRPQAILDGASELFREFGYYGASLRDISRRVGISHPGMLHHFASKEDILNRVIDRLEEHAQDALDRQDEFCTDQHALLRGLVETWDPTSPQIQLLAKLDADAISEEHPGRWRMARLRCVHEHVLAHCFTALSSQGLLRTGIDPSFAARTVLALVLCDAVREQTVRRLRHDASGDAPHEDLCRLACSFFAT
ncbi:hypothetical protein BH708_06025 [Brachybacterium sp. P6-10-X1]|uniref:TetR/AcrR family transcriptional regulator n=1 Tax=Brachybacterium sp. P6-10-X1 TaxID=1903186 RepID=UPI000971A00C|nr:TetR/AcrR family transcriptional regulator [Brachybacterium sp. P6-10-X1]APX32351.1 hypothetical protein BH708_06025 [Brachybacterium sp. P6-10-X1]